MTDRSLPTTFLRVFISNHKAVMLSNLFFFRASPSGMPRTAQALAPSVWSEQRYPVVPGSGRTTRTTDSIRALNPVQHCRPMVFRSTSQDAALERSSQVQPRHSTTRSLVFPSNAPAPNTWREWLSQSCRICFFEHSAESSHSCVTT
ncbi:uncharacterized protein UHOD_20988 [Ustilago sp. UG-2017b]|nr:uncharacterized protein UHOD_20988 [Ustilago sp. UG-2017b]